jgi:hypothetical protein
MSVAVERAGAPPAPVSALLVVTVDGYAKRVPLADIPGRRRGRKGVALSSVPVAAAIAIDGGELVIATANGKIERVAVTSVPERRRRVLSSGRLAKGVPVIALAPGDRVASATLASEGPPNAAAGVAQCAPAGDRGTDWPWGSTGLRAGEKIADAIVIHPPRPLAAIATGGDLAVPRDEWAKTAVHRASTYFCAHCGAQYAHPEEVYGCIDRHAVAHVSPSEEAP